MATKTLADIEGYVDIEVDGQSVILDGEFSIGDLLVIIQAMKEAQNGNQGTSNQ